MTRKPAAEQRTAALIQHILASRSTCIKLTNTLLSVDVVSAFTFLGEFAAQQEDSIKMDRSTLETAETYCVRL